MRTILKNGLGLLICLALTLPLQAAERASDLLEQARTAQKAEHHQEAIELLNQALEAKPKGPEAVKILRLRAESWQYLGDMTKAEADLKSGLEQARTAAEKVEVLEGLGWLKLFQKDYPAAEDFLSQALALDPQHYWARLNLAHTLLLQNRHGKALILYCGLAQASPDKPLSQVLAKDYARLNAHGILHLDYGLMLLRFGSAGGACPQS